MSDWTTLKVFPVLTTSMLRACEWPDAEDEILEVTLTADEWAEVGGAGVDWEAALGARTVLIFGGKEWHIAYARVSGTNRKTGAMKVTMDGVNARPPCSPWEFLRHRVMAMYQ